MWRWRDEIELRASQHSSTDSWATWIGCDTFWNACECSTGFHNNKCLSTGQLRKSCSRELWTINKSRAHNCRPNCRSNSGGGGIRLQWIVGRDAKGSSRFELSAKHVSSGCSSSRCLERSTGESNLLHAIRSKQHCRVTSGFRHRAIGSHLNHINHLDYQHQQHRRYDTTPSFSRSWPFTLGGNEMKLSLGAVCTDPITGDQLICPPGTQCDPAGSNTCVGTLDPNAAPCPLNVNLTGYTPCSCPSGYELDATANQCVTPGVAPVIAPQLIEGTGASSATGLSPTVLLIGAGVLIYFFMEGGGGGRRR
jgi:hypothetical protein